MSITGRKLIFGAMALAVAGGAMANTTIDATTKGDLFLNIVDTTTNTSYLFDTGVSQASFNGNGNYSFDLSTDASLTAFLAVSGGVFYYSVVSGLQTGGNSVDITGNVAPFAITSTKSGNARAAIGSFLSTANGVSSTSSVSAVMNTAALSWNNALFEGVASKQVFNVSATPYADQANLNTALNFYNVKSTATTFAGTWDFTTSNNTLAYTSSAPVPLPAPFLLLASGLGLMGVISRRNKAAA
jgi:hypothetical protein